MNLSSYCEYYCIHYCKNCYKDILKSLENSVEMLMVQGECNTYTIVHSENQIKDVQNLTAKHDRNFTLIDNKWKFTNDSRRKIIKAINNDPPLK